MSKKSINMTVQEHAANIAYGRRHYAKKHGIVADYSPEFIDYVIKLAIETTRCVVFRDRPLLTWCSSENKASDYSPSLDRIVPELGYVIGNVRWISKRANMLKSNASVPEMEDVLADLISVTDEKCN